MAVPSRQSPVSEPMNSFTFWCNHVEVGNPTKARHHSFCAMVATRVACPIIVVQHRRGSRHMLPTVKKVRLSPQRANSRRVASMHYAGASPVLQMQRAVCATRPGKDSPASLFLLCLTTLRDEVSTRQVIGLGPILCLVGSQIQLILVVVR